MLHSLSVSLDWSLQFMEFKTSCIYITIIIIFVLRYLFINTIVFVFFSNCLVLLCIFVRFFYSVTIVASKDGCLTWRPHGPFAASIPLLSSLKIHLLQFFDITSYVVIHDVRSVNDKLGKFSRCQSSLTSYKQSLSYVARTICFLSFMNRSFQACCWVKGLVKLGIW